MTKDDLLIAEIEKRRAGGATYESIAADCGVSSALIWKIERGQCASRKVSRAMGIRHKPVDRMAARLTVAEGERARAMLAEGGYSSITEFWREFIQLAD
jgi:transcriptional regulator with XRE-family HTH domain